MKRWYLREIFLWLRRTLSATIISVLGMSVGIVIFLLIMLYVRTELRVNKNLPEYENIYRISSEDGSRWQGTPARIGEILTANLPEVKNFARIDPGGMNHFIKVDNTPFRTGKFVYADSSFFKIFTLPFKFGDPDKSLEDKFNIVITESLSNSIFGDESPVGRMVRLDNRFDVYITGVIFDPGQETNIDGNVFISFHSMPEMKNWPDLYDCWGCYNYQTYLLLEENTDPLIVKTKINEALDRFGTDNSVQELIDDEFTLTDMHDVYFGPEERPDFRKGNYTTVKDTWIDRDIDTDNRYYQLYKPVNRKCKFQTEANGLTKG